MLSQMRASVLVPLKSTFSAPVVGGHGFVSAPDLVLSEVGLVVVAHLIIRALDFLLGAEG